MEEVRNTHKILVVKPAGKRRRRG